jgi:hypothetical protein
VATPSAWSSNRRGYVDLFEGRGRKGVSAKASVAYKTSPSKTPPGPPVSHQPSAAPTPTRVTLIPTPPLSLCQTRVFPAAKCAFYGFAPPPEPEPNKKKKRPRPSPEALAAAAADRAIALAIEPDLRVAPGRIGLTGLPSYFWLADKPRPVTATAGAGGLTVTAEARPVQFVWDFGDGSDKVTTHSGRRWTQRHSGNVSHLYETKGRHELGVEVIWEARWRINAGSWQPLGYFSNSDDRPYPVREVVAMLVRSR